jgi:hypothetical protein
VAIGGNNLYPSLETVTSLFRSTINDDGAGSTGTAGGQIATDTATFMLPYLNAAIRDLYSDLRMINDQTLIIDNYILYGLPVINAALNPPNPAAQVSLSSLGFFDGISFNPNFTLPSQILNIERVWVRLNQGTPNAQPFYPTEEAKFGLPACVQGEMLGSWELRGDAIWWGGSLSSCDIRLRGNIQFQPLAGTNLQFANIFVPVYDCERNLADKMMIRYARRFAPEQYATAVKEEAKSLFKLKFEIVYRRQTTENARADWGGTDDFLPWASQL